MGRPSLATGRFNTIVSLKERPALADRVIGLYLLLTVLLYIDRAWNGMLISQIQPSFFVTPLNITTWFLMFTHVHHAFIEYPLLRVCADVLLVGLPIVYGIFYFARCQTLRLITGWLILAFNFIYAQCYVLYPSNSIEGHIGWIVFPLVLICSSSLAMNFALRAVRYFFLFFFFSAAVWKLRGGGLFNLEEMSGILLYQHAALLVISPDSSLAKMYYWLIQHPGAGYALYLMGFGVECFFLVGFFTSRFDKVLLGLFVLFLVMDVLIMQIKYWEVAYLTIPLFFSGSLQSKTDKIPDTKQPAAK